MTLEEIKNQLVELRKSGKISYWKLAYGERLLTRAFEYQVLGMGEESNEVVRRLERWILRHMPRLSRRTQALPRFTAFDENYLKTLLNQIRNSLDKRRPLIPIPEREAMLRRLDKVEKRLKDPSELSLSKNLDAQSADFPKAQSAGFSPNTLAEFSTQNSAEFQKEPPAEFQKVPSATFPSQTLATTLPPKNFRALQQIYDELFGIRQELVARFRRSFRARKALLFPTSAAPASFPPSEMIGPYNTQKTLHETFSFIGSRDPIWVEDFTEIYSELFRYAETFSLEKTASEKNRVKNSDEKQTGKKSP